MRKLKLIITTLLLFPFRFFSNISPFALVRCSTVSKKSAILSGTRFYKSTINDYSFVARNCFINTTEIGKYCSISDNCILGLASHPLDWVSTSNVFHVGANVLKKNFSLHPFKSIRQTIVQNDVWIGMNAIISGGVTIGTGAVVAAAAVVTKDVPPYAIVGGVPAKIIRFRFEEETINALLKSEWWDWDEGTLLKQAAFFNKPEVFIKQLQRESLT